MHRSTKRSSRSRELKYETTEVCQRLRCIKISEPNVAKIHKEYIKKLVQSVEPLSVEKGILQPFFSRHNSLAIGMRFIQQPTLQPSLYP